MGVKFIHCFIFLVGFLLSSGSFANDFPSHRLLIPVSDTESLDTMPQLDVTTPMTTFPTINPTNPTTTTPTVNPYTTPTTPASPVTSQSWCVASQSASQGALQVALDYACGYGGSDCSPIRQGGSCFNPNTLRDHGSYAFNSYYQRNPVPTSCDFGGTAIVTNTDPSTSTCQYPLSSRSSSTTRPTNPSGSTVFGSSTSDYSGTIPNSMNVSPFIMLTILLFSLVYLNVYE